MAVAKKFWKVLGVIVLGLLALFLLVFFVVMFFSSNKSLLSTSGVRNMTYKNPQVTGWAAVGGSQLSFDGTNGYRQAAEKSSVSMMEATPAATMVLAEKKIVRNGALYLRVADVDQAVARIGQIAGELGGDVADSNFNQVSFGIKSGTVAVKVPTDKFNEAFGRLKGIATLVLSESTSGSDVTEQYIDLQARINNKKAAEVTLQTLFERAVKISDVMEVTDKLSQVRSEIESLEGQLRYLNSRTDMASITLSLTEDATIVTDQGFRPMQTLKESLKTLVHMLGNLAEGVIRFLILGLPTLLAYGLIFWLIYRYSRTLVMKFFGETSDGKKRAARKG